jgi:hypothetical protein
MVRSSSQAPLGKLASRVPAQEPWTCVARWWQGATRAHRRAWAPSPPRPQLGGGAARAGRGRLRAVFGWRARPGDAQGAGHVRPI